MSRTSALVRLAEGFDNQAAFAARMGIGPTAFSQYENGVKISTPSVIKIADGVPGLTTDYLFEGMPPEL